MKNRFIRCFSPITTGVTLAIIFAVILNGYYAITKIIESQNGWNICYVVIEAFAILIAALMTKEVLKNGVKFTENTVEFTGLDDNNIFEYSHIIKVEASKDTSASLKKNFVDRYSQIIIYLDDESSVTIVLGLTTKKTLNAIETEIKNRMIK